MDALLRLCLVASSLFVATGANYQTPNFHVTASTPQIAKRVGDAAEEYRREKHLPRHLGQSHLPKPAAALLRLFELERDMNEARRTKATGYSVVSHVDLLIAIVGEARLLRAPLP